MSASRVLSGGADDRYPGRRINVQATSTGKMSKAERLNRVGRLLKQTPRQLARRYGTDGKMTDAGLARAERNAGVEHRVGAMDYDAHFGGTGVSLQRSGDTEVPLDADSLLYAMKAFKRKLQQGIEAKKRQTVAELTGELGESERAPQLVHSCDTAGPGLTYCDPLTPKSCPDPKDLVGTPYENIWSTIGVPPNNKVVQCVPRDLVPLVSESEQKEEDMERRMHKVMTVLGNNAKGILNLSKWRDAAPCDAIPAMAFGENNNMCRSLHFKDDKMATRCMDDRAALKLSQDDTVVQRATVSKENPDTMRTCFENPKELVRKINERTHRVQLWRQKLRDVVQEAMRVPDFVQLFNKLGAKLASKYGRPNNDATPITWSVVNDYMTRDGTAAVDDLLDKKPCAEARKEIERMDALLKGGAADECDDEQGCNRRLLRVLKVMSRTLKEEHELRTAYGTWVGANKKKIDALADDENCNSHAKTDNYCSIMKETCGAEFKECTEIPATDMPTECLRTPGGKYVSLHNHGVTWDVERYNDDGEPVGFRWLADPDVRKMFDEYTEKTLQSCAFNRNQLWSTAAQLKTEHSERTKKLMAVLLKTYDTAAQKLHSETYKEAVDMTQERSAMRSIANDQQLENLVANAVSRALEGITGGRDIDLLSFVPPATLDEVTQPHSTTVHILERPAKLAALETAQHFIFNRFLKADESDRKEIIAELQK